MSKLNLSSNDRVSIQQGIASADRGSYYIPADTVLFDDEITSKGMNRNE